MSGFPYQQLPIFENVGWVIWGKSNLSTSLQNDLQKRFWSFELEELLNDEAKIKEKIKNEQKQAYLNGFERGVLVSLSVLNGQLPVSQKLTPWVVSDKPRYRVVTGKQMELFDK